MKFKKVIVALLLVSICFCMFGCDWPFKPDTPQGLEADIIYGKLHESHNYYSVGRLSKQGQEKEVVYIPDEIRGLPVQSLGLNSLLIARNANFIFTKTKRIYFPWSIIYNTNNARWGGNPEYIISATTSCWIAPGMGGLMFVVPKFSFDQMMEFGKIGSSTMDKTSRNVIPANIAYFFNYEENPNEGYFFIDLVEETGKLVKPPYDPQREGYTFSGWYTDPQCTNEWNFDSDTVTINYDKEGNRIYEEFCLYAKWTK